MSHHQGKQVDRDAVDEKGRHIGERLAILRSLGDALCVSNGDAAKPPWCCIKREGRGGERDSRFPFFCVCRSCTGPLWLGGAIMMARVRYFWIFYGRRGVVCAHCATVFTRVCQVMEGHACSIWVTLWRGVDIIIS